MRLQVLRTNLAFATLLLFAQMAGAAVCARADLRVTARPQDALVDTPVRIVARVPFARTAVTIEATAQIDGTPYRSWGLYRTNKDGLLNLATAAPQRGTYSGIDPMGLFWSMVPERNAGFMPASLRPFSVRLTLYARRQVARITLRRDRIAPDVKRLPVENAPFVGTLFLHDAGKASGLVIVLGGSEGGMDENRAAIIASHGFDALALAYFGMASLPADLANIPLEYVDRAIDWVHTQATLKDLPLVLEGDSKGSELALMVAARNSAIKGVVAFAPSSAVFEGFSAAQGQQRASWSVGGVPLRYANSPVPASIKAQIRADRAQKRAVSYRTQYLALATPPQEASTIHVEDIHAPVLLVAGADDQLWPSDIFARRVIARRQSSAVQAGDELLIYEHAGHQIDVPYLPTTGLSTFNEGSFKLALGGDAAGYARADAAMWPRVLAFMRRACGH